jgi:hypothetical protein
MKKIRGDEPIGVIIHIYMETSQGNSLCSYHYLKLKCHDFHFIFSLFFFYKIGKQEDRMGPVQGGGLAPVEVGR